MTVAQKERYEAILRELGVEAADEYLKGASESDFDGGCLLWVGGFLIVAFFVTRAGLWPALLGGVAFALGLVIAGAGRMPWLFMLRRSDSPDQTSGNFIPPGNL